MFSKFGGEFLSESPRFTGDFHLLHFLYMGGVMIDFIARQPLAKLLHEELVFEVFAPKAAVSDPGLF